MDEEKLLPKSLFLLSTSYDLLPNTLERKDVGIRIHLIRLEVLGWYPLLVLPAFDLDQWLFPA
jgi:hypothetical protein